MIERQLRWFGHTKRMTNDRLLQKMVEMTMDRTRPGGRPRQRYRDIIKSDKENKEAGKI